MPSNCLYCGRPANMRGKGLPGRHHWLTRLLLLLKPNGPACPQCWSVLR